ncbi:MAG: helix-turn-helix domain-containing protein [Acidimicrobiales bacterium]
MPESDLREKTYLPQEDAAGIESVAAFLRVLRSHDTRTRRQHLLLGADGAQVPLPDEVYRVLRQVVEALSHGLAVTVAPQTQVVTTQQAAEILGMSRPTLIRLLDAGQIPFEHVGKHRRLLLRDVLSFREHRRREQYAALDAMAIPLDDEGDVDEMMATVREARREVAARRRESA